MSGDPFAAAAPADRRALPRVPASRTVPLPRAAIRLLRLGWLIVRGGVELRLFDEGAAARQRRVRRWAAAVLRVLGIELRARGSIGGEPVLVMANHVSWLDVVVLLAHAPQLRFVAKADVRHWPLVGPLVARAGTLFIERGSHRAAHRATVRMAATLQDGGSIGCFPEGTTTRGDALLPFASGLFEAACASGRPVLPVLLRYRDGGAAPARAVPYVDDDTLLHSLWRLCRADGVEARLQVLQPLDAASADRRRLAGEAHAALRAALALARALEPTEALDRRAPAGGRERQPPTASSPSAAARRDRSR